MEMTGQRRPSMFSWRSGISIGQPLPIETIERNSYAEFKRRIRSDVTGRWNRV
jgi:hypothetical protein